MLKIIYKPIYRILTESSQENPLRWMMLQKTGEDEYENTSPVFKCKDYLNDFVLNSHGYTPFSVYGMESTDGVVNEEGGFTILLQNVTVPLMNNINNVINKEFGPVWGVNITCVTDDQLEVYNLSRSIPSMVIHISKEALVSTCRISLMAALIRNCNVDNTWASYDELVNSEYFKVENSDFSRPYLMVLQERKYDFPEQRDYFFYVGEKYNSKTYLSTENTTVLHNAGFISTVYPLLTTILNKDLDTIYNMENEHEDEDNEDYEWAGEDYPEEDAM